MQTSRQQHLLVQNMRQGLQGLCRLGEARAQEQGILQGQGSSRASQWKSQPGPVLETSFFRADVALWVITIVSGTRLPAILCRHEQWNHLFWFSVWMDAPVFKNERDHEELSLKKAQHLATCLFHKASSIHIPYTWLHVWFIFRSIHAMLNHFPCRGVLLLHSASCMI